MALIALLAWGDRYPFVDEIAPSQQGPALFLDELSQAVAGAGAILRQGCQSELYNFLRVFQIAFGLLVFRLSEISNANLCHLTHSRFVFLQMPNVTNSNMLRCFHS